MQQTPPLSPIIDINDTPSFTSASNAPIKRDQSDSFKLVIGIIILVVIAVVVGIFIGKNQNKPTAIVQPEPPTSQPSPIPTVLPTRIDISITLTPEKESLNISNSWSVYTHSGFSPLADGSLGSNGFVLSYPNSWKLSEEKDTSMNYLLVKLQKDNGDYFQIIQGPGGGGYCLFPEQPEYDTFNGYAIKFTDFQEIIKENSIVWRLAKNPESNSGETHTLCAKFDSDMFVTGFMDSTPIGFTKIRSSSPESTPELVEILSRLKIVDRI